MIRRKGPLKNDGPVYLTAHGLETLKSELARLKQSLPRLAAEAARTAAYGDRSENAEYKQAKGSLRRAHYRIFEIEDQLKRAELISTEANPSGIVQLGSTVVLESEGRRLTFQILGPHETDPGTGRISHESPLGSRLMQKKAGDEITVDTPAGTKTYRVLEVR